MKFNILFSTLLALYFLSACQKDKQTTPAPAGGGANTVQGPSDGGGGDTCNGKMIEGYKVDITSLVEYKEIIQPILDKITLPQLQSDKKNEAPFLLTPIFKNWYIIDCKLQDIPKERKGLYLETFQTAIHTSREIFIDSSSYNKMEKEEKAKLILHEMMMSYYLMKYLSLEDICKMSNSCSGDFAVANKWKIFKPEIYRPLNEEDHQKIRNVTAWMWLQKEILTPEGFSKILKNNDFDKRFEIVSGSNNSDSKEVEIDIQVLLRMFKKYQWTNSFPKFCQFNSETNLSSSSCQTEIRTDIRDYPISANSKIKQLYLKIKITRNPDQKIFEQEFSYPLSTETQKVKFYISKIGSVLSAAPFGMTANWPAQFGVEPKEGLKSQMLFFWLNLNDNENPEIYQMTFQNYVWYNFEDVIVKKDTQTYKETYGYASLLNDESENLFIENELPFTFNSVFKNKVFIKLEQIIEKKLDLPTN